MDLFTSNKPILLDFDAFSELTSKRNKCYFILFYYDDTQSEFICKKYNECSNYTSPNVLYTCDCSKEQRVYKFLQDNKNLYPFDGFPFLCFYSDGTPHKIYSGITSTTEICNFILHQSCVTIKTKKD